MLRNIIMVIILSLISSISYAQEYTARMSMHWNDKHHCTIHAKMFAEEVFKNSNGRLKIELFHSGQLFGIREIMAGVTSGAVDLGGVVGVVGFPKINKNFNVATIPGLFESFEQQRDFFQLRGLSNQRVYVPGLPCCGSALWLHRAAQQPARAHSGARRRANRRDVRVVQHRRPAGRLWRQLRRRNVLRRPLPLPGLKPQPLLRPAVLTTSVGGRVYEHGFPVCSPWPRGLVVRFTAPGPRAMTQAPFAKTRRLGAFCRTGPGKR